MTDCIELEWVEAEPVDQTYIVPISAGFRQNPPRTPRKPSGRTASSQSSDPATVDSLDRATALALVDAGYMPLRRYHELFEEEISTPSIRLKAS